MLTVLKCPVSFLTSLLSAASIVTSLQSFHYRWQTQDDLVDLTALLPMLSLKAFRLVNYIPYYDKRSTPEPGIYQELLAALPSSIRCLSLDDLDGKGIKHLTRVLTVSLGQLEELHLFYLHLESPDDVECLSLALRTAPFGKHLKTLELHYDAEFSWELSSHILGLQEQDTEILPRLLILKLNDINWTLMGEHLMKGRLPSVAKVQPSSFSGCDEMRGGSRSEYHRRCRDWYEVDAATICVWFQVLKFRQQLEPFESFFFKGPQRANCAKEFLLHLPRALDLNMISCVQSIECISLCDVNLDNELCESLSLAIQSHNFKSVKCVILDFEETCSSGALVTLGQVLHHASLPSLSNIALRGKVREVDSWRAFFSALLIVDGLWRLESFILDGLTGPMLEALKRSSTLDQLSCLFLVGRRYQSQAYLLISEVLSAGAFSRLVDFSF